MAEGDEEEGRLTAVVSAPTPPPARDTDSLPALAERTRHLVEGHSPQLPGTEGASNLEKFLISPGFRWGSVSGLLACSLFAPAAWTWVPTAFLLSWLWAMLSPIYPYILYRQGKFQRCADLQRILKDSSLFSSNRAIHGLNLASALSQLGKAGEALELLEAIPADNIPRRHRKVHYINRILFCLRLGDLERARDLLSKAPRNLPPWLAPYLELSRASLALQEGRARECLHMLENSPSLTRSADLAVATAAMKADALLEVGRFGDALPLAESALGDPRVRPGAHLLMAEALLMSGKDLGEILDHLLKAADEAPRLSVRGQGLLYLHLAHVFFRLGLNDTAEGFRRMLGDLGIQSPSFMMRVSKLLGPYIRGAQYLPPSGESSQA